MNRFLIFSSLFALFFVSNTMPMSAQMPVESAVEAQPMAEIACTHTVPVEAPPAPAIALTTPDEHDAQAAQSEKAEAASIAHELRKTIQEELAKARNSSFVRNHPISTAAVIGAVGVTALVYFRKPVARVCSGIGRLLKAGHSFATTLIYGSSIESMAANVATLQQSATVADRRLEGIEGTLAREAAATADHFGAVQADIANTRDTLNANIQATAERVEAVARDLGQHATVTKDSIAQANAAITTLQRETEALQKALADHRSEMGDRARMLHDALIDAARRLEALENQYARLQKAIEDTPQNTVACLMLAMQKQRLSLMGSAIVPSIVGMPWARQNSLLPVRHEALPKAPEKPEDQG